MAMDLRFFAPLAALVTRRPPITSTPFGHRPVGPVQVGYQRYARAYASNEIVYSAVGMLATSAAEPHILGRRWRRNSPHIRNETERLKAAGLPLREVYNRLIENKFVEDMPNHPLVQLLEKPNPWMSHGQMWGTVVMDMALAGNAYLLKARVPQGPMKGAAAELWRLRPDHVRIIPSKTKFIEGYEYGTGRDTMTYRPEDIVHFKARNPLDAYYGMPPLMAASGRVEIDEAMRTFLRSFYESGGSGPGSILTIKQGLSAEARTEIEDGIKRKFGHVTGPQEWLVLDNTESSYNRVGLERGLRDALPAELDAVNEARIAMVFGIPGSILGLKIGYESSSYANKRQDWQVFWDLTMTPLLSDFQDTLNLQLTPEFGGIDEVLFDLSNIRALQEDVDGIHKRYRDDWAMGGMSWLAFREAIGQDPNDTDGVFLVPSNLMPVLGDVLAGKVPMPVAPAPPQIPERTEPEPEPAAMLAEVRHGPCNNLIAKDVMGNPELHCHSCNAKFRAKGAEGVAV